MVAYLYADDGGRMQSPVSESRRSGMVVYLYADDGGRMQSLVSEPVEAAWSSTFMPMTADGCNHLSLNLVEAAAGRH